MAHLKRYMMPKWPVETKAETFIVRPNAGPHALQESMPLLVLLRDQLQYGETKKEVKTILNEGNILVDNVIRKDIHFPVGVMDTISIPTTKESFRVTIQKGNFTLEPIPAADTKKKLCRIEGKTTLKKGLTQLNLHDGRNILVKEKTFAVGDTIEIELPSQKILTHLKCQEGATCIISGGKGQGTQGTLKTLSKRTDMRSKNTALVQTESGEAETLAKYIFITGTKGTKSTKKAEPKPKEKK